MIFDISRMRTTWPAAPLSIALLAGCASRQTLPPGGNEVVKEGVIAISGSWYKKKSSKVDASLVVKNKSGQFLSIPNSDLQCLLGEQVAKADFRLDFASSNIDPLKNALGDSILLSPDEEKKLDVVCRFDNTEGPFGLRVRNVYKRVTASGDSTTVERLGSDITWWAEGRH